MRRSVELLLRTSWFKRGISFLDVRILCGACCMQGTMLMNVGRIAVDREPLTGKAVAKSNLFNSVALLKSNLDIFMILHTGMFFEYCTYFRILLH